MATDNLTIVSVDTHVGPRLQDDLRSYCPSDRLEDFDGFAAESARLKETIAGVAAFLVEHPNFSTPGHYDSAARLADYDYDGVAAGVIFHASENLEPLPFGSLFPGDKPRSRDLTAVGLQMYNRWLADFVATAPDRHIGLAYLPMWDIDASIRELAWAHDHGLKGVNFPALRHGEILEYNDRAWDPFWAACEERDLPLVTHVGAAGNVRYSGPEAYAIKLVESGGFFSHRAVWWLIYGGVFERFPGLRLMITETPGDWFPGLARELDGGWAMFQHQSEMNGAFLEQVPRRPSEYMHENVFLGASFASPHEVELAVEHGFVSQLSWGSDYPHVEGTYLNPAGSDLPSVTRLSLRNTFCDAPPDAIRRMVGGNAIEVFGLDESVLQRIATDIGAPTMEELTTPIDRQSIPAGASLHAFRSGDAGWS
jgi:predicted TIM-barrel fold metal-dependent hydrolase